MNKEKWKIHSSGLIVSDNGSVMNRKGKLCFKKVIPGNNYRCVKISNNKVLTVFKAHNLVWELFGSEPLKNGYEINHIDGVKWNNNISNLEQVTRSENQKHAFRIGLHPKRHTTKLDEDDVLLIRFIGKQVTHRSLCEHFGVAHSTIGSILNYKSWITKSQFSL